mgnify:CR=1 FL=1
MMLQAEGRMYFFFSIMSTKGPFDAEAPGVSGLIRLSASPYYV